VAYDPRICQVGDVILVRGSAPGEPWWNRLLDAAIVWSEANPYHHAAIVGQGHLIEALSTVTTSPTDKYAPVGDLFHVQAPADARWRAAQFAESRIGQPYGLGELALDFVRLDLHVPPWRTAPPRLVTCSGLVQAAYLSSDVFITHAPWPTPADLSYSPLLAGVRPWEATL